ncbi:MAG: SHOCT domain-containing protein [Desulfurivibrionaceae bacterium]
MLVRGFGGWGYGGYCNWGPFEGGGWFFGWIMPLLFWGVLIFIVVQLIRLLIRKDGDHTGGESPLDIAKKRYAAGEINPQEFDEMRAKLS